MKVPGSILLVLTLALSLSEGYVFSSSASCKKLEVAIKNFINDRSQPDTLYSIFEDLIFIPDSFLLKLEKSSGYKFFSGRSLRDFSCKIAGAKSRNALAGILGVSRRELDTYYKKFIGPIIEVGGVKHMRDISQVVGLLMAWSAKTGYPIMPFKKVDDRITLRTFEAIKKAMMQKYVHDTIINAPFPLKVSPQRALKYMKTAKTYKDFERGVFLDPHQLEDFAAYVKNNRDAITKGSRNVRSTMAFITALEETGILYLK